MKFLSTSSITIRNTSIIIKFSRKFPRKKFIIISLILSEVKYARKIVTYNKNSLNDS